VHTDEIHIAGGREAASEIRRELFVFSEILDVFTTSRADSLVVVFRGRPRPAEWNSRLRDAGYEPLRRPARSSDGAIAQSRALPRQESDVLPDGLRGAAHARHLRARRRRRTRATLDLPYVSPGPAPSRLRPSGSG
jgi:hypothetical protein